jgi:adenylate cyclase
VNVNPAKIAPWLIVGLVTTLVGLVRLQEERDPEFDFVRKFEWITYDWRVTSALRWPGPKADNLGAVLIDDESIAQLNRERQVSYPWPRNIYQPVIDELNAQGVKAIGFDILFSEVHDAQMLAQAPDGTLMSTDQIFVDALARSSNIVLAANQGLLPAPLFRSVAMTTGDIAADSDTDGTLRRVKPFRVYKEWNPYLERILTHPQFQFDLATGYIRDKKLIVTQAGAKEPTEIPLDSTGRLDLAELVEQHGVPEGQSTAVMPYREVRVWHLGVVLAARTMGFDLDRADVEPERILLRAEDGTERVIPLDRKGYFQIDWSLPQDAKGLARNSFKDVWLMAAKHAKAEPVDPAWTAKWQDKIVVVGSIATGNNVSDIGKSPLGANTFLVSKHWNVANSVITGRFIQRSSFGFELLLIVVLGAGAGLVTWRLRAPWPSVWIASVAILYVLAALFLYVQSRYWLPIVLPVAGSLLLNHLAVESYRVVFEQREKRRVKSVFAKLVSPNVVDEMLKSEKLNLGGTRRKITVFFADVRGFTSMTDEYAAKADEYVRTHHLEGDAAEAYFNQQAAITLETVNMYLSAIADKVKEHQGTLDKYMGDCVMAFWGMPTPNPQHALSCVRAAIDAQRAMYALNQRRAEDNQQIEAENLERIQRGEEPRQLNTLLALGTGINTGHAIIGLMGSERHILNYTVFGREVNIASRLEGVSGRGRIIIGEATYEEILRDDSELAATCMELEPVMVKGIKKPVRIYEVPWKQGKEQMPTPAAGDLAATGFFRLEKGTMQIPKSAVDTPDKPGEAPAEKPPAKSA